MAVENDFQLDIENAIWVRSSLLGSTDTLSTFDGTYKGSDKDRLVITNEDRKRRMYKSANTYIHNIL